VLLLLLALSPAAPAAPAAPLDQACPSIGVSTVPSGTPGQLLVTITAGTQTTELRFG
jgi:hypothetical protein